MVYYTRQPIEKGIHTTSHKKKEKKKKRNRKKKTAINLQTTILERLKKQNDLLTQPFLILKSVVSTTFLLLSVIIRYCHSFKSYKVQSWKAVYISRRCQIAEKDNNCVNFWCRKSLGKLNHVPTSNKTDSFSILELFCQN